MKRLILFIIILMGANPFSCYADPPSKSQIDQILAEFERNEKTKGVFTGLSIYDVLHQSTFYSYNASKTFVPASNMKLLVTAAALDILSPEYRFKTELYVDGVIQPDGVLQGDLILKGYGDPSLNVNDLRQFARQLKSKGIQKMTGNLIMDETFYDDVRLGPGWMWDDEAYDFSAQISALSLNKNTVTVEIFPSRQIGGLPSVTVSPDGSYIKIINRGQLIEGLDQQIKIRRGRGSNHIFLSGFMGIDSNGMKEYVTIEDPATFTGQVFRNVLQKEGIQLSASSQVLKSPVSKGTACCIHYSAPLRELIIPLNKNSDNFYAEMLLKAIGAHEGKQGSFEAGSKAVSSYMQRAGAEGIYHIVDGSGLSRLNRITPQQMTQLLNYVLEQPYKDNFIHSLPVGGMDGTLKYRMKAIDSKRRIIAKTGTMQGVSCLSGYVMNQYDVEFSFSIFLNGYAERTSDLRKLQDDICSILSLHFAHKNKPEFGK